MQRQIRSSAASGSSSTAPGGAADDVALLADEPSMARPRASYKSARAEEVPASIVRMNGASAWAQGDRWHRRPTIIVDCKLQITD